MYFNWEKGKVYLTSYEVKLVGLHQNNLPQIQVKEKLDEEQLNNNTYFDPLISPRLVLDMASTLCAAAFYEINESTNAETLALPDKRLLPPDKAKSLKQRCQDLLELVDGISPIVFDQGFNEFISKLPPI